MDLMQAKKMYEDYNCNEYNMKIDGVLETYKSYGISLELQEKWKQEFIEREIAKIEDEKNLHSLSMVGSFAKSSTQTYILLKLYNIFKVKKEENDYYFLSKICCTLINSINLFHIKNDPTFIGNLIDEVLGTMNEIDNKVDNNEYIRKVFEENNTIENTKKILDRYKKEALKIKEKTL